MSLAFTQWDVGLAGSSRKTSTSESHQSSEHNSSKSFPVYGLAAALNLCLLDGEPMSTVPATLQRVSWLRPKYFLFAVIALLVAYVLRHNEYFLVDPKAPVWEHYRPFKWWLLPHALAGSCALLLGPLQFSDRLRKRFTRLHRVVGRFYVAGAFLAAPLGTYIQYFEERM